MTQKSVKALLCLAIALGSPLALNASEKWDLSNSINSLIHGQNEVQAYLTIPESKVQFQRRALAITSTKGSSASAAASLANAASGANNSAANSGLNAGSTKSDKIILDPSTTFQIADGFGASITDASVLNINQLPADKRAKALRILFDPQTGYGLNFLRLPIGSTDFSPAHYTYDDTPGNTPDPELKTFNMSSAEPTLQMLKEIQAINPSLKIMVSPWSPPAWMKTSNSLNGGELKPEYRAVYAAYLIKAMKVIESRGIRIYAMTVQNEPYHNSPHYPTMYMPIDQQAAFIADQMVPGLAANGLGHVKILVHDHNYDGVDQANSIRNDVKNVTARGFKGFASAFHCYKGDVDAIQSSQDEIYQTECTGEVWGSRTGDFQWWASEQLIKAGRFGARSTLAWNLALNKESHGPYLGAYCDHCRGLLDIDQATKKIEVAPELVALGHLAKFLKPGAVRIASNDLQDSPLTNVAYLNRDGSIVVMVLNRGDDPASFTAQIAKAQDQEVAMTLPGHSAVTLVW